MGEIIFTKMKTCTTNENLIYKHLRVEFAAPTLCKKDPWERKNNI